MHELSRLSWIKITCYILIIANALEAINSLLVIEATYATYAYLFSTILSGFVFYWVSIYGLNQKNLLLGIEDENTTSTTIENPTVAILAPSNQKNIQPEYYQEKYNKIVCFVTETKIYKDKELNLFTIANLLQMPYREVSNVINKFANKNFNLFLNEFRVEEAKHLISEDSSDKFNLTWIAEEVGFNSRSTFFAAFKTIAGLTPAEYKKSQRTL
jgi:AraC-like DNA-binding protein